MQTPDARSTEFSEEDTTSFLTLRAQLVRRLEILAEALQTRSENLELSLAPGRAAGPG